MTEFQYDIYNLIHDRTIVSQQGAFARNLIRTHFEMVKG